MPPRRFLPLPLEYQRWQPKMRTNMANPKVVLLVEDDCSEDRHTCVRSVGLFD